MYFGLHHSQHSSPHCTSERRSSTEPCAIWRSNALGAADLCRMYPAACQRDEWREEMV